MKKIWFISLTFCFLVVFTHHNSQAVEDIAEPSNPGSVDQVEAETPAFSNPAQAAHAANLSAEAASALDGNVENAEANVENAESELDTAQTDLKASRTEVKETKVAVETAETNLTEAIAGRKAAKKAFDEGEIDEAALRDARKAVRAARTDLEAAQTNLETAKGDRKSARADRDMAETELAAAEAALDEAISDLAGVSEKAISDMRNSGMGLGQVAHALGVHPSALGLGRTKMKGKNFNNGPADDLTEDPAGDLPAPEVEIAEATKRDIQHGWAKNHGLATSGSSSSKKGLGLSETDLGIGSKGSNSSKGKSGSKSAGSSSKGNSKSDRGSVGGPSNDKSSAGGSSSGKSKSDRGKTGGPSNDKDKSENNGKGNDKSGGKGNKGGNSGKK